MEIINTVGTWLVQPWWHIVAIAVGLTLTWIGCVQVSKWYELKAFIKVFNIYPEEDTSDMAVVRTVLIDLRDQMGTETHKWKEAEAHTNWLNVPLEQMRYRRTEAKVQKIQRDKAIAAFCRAVVLAADFGYVEALGYVGVSRQEVSGFWKRRFHRQAYQDHLLTLCQTSGE